MHHGPQRNVGVVAIVKLQLLSDYPEPNVGLFNGVIQNGDARRAHKRVLTQLSE
jgi:hypothetical protein